MSEFAANAPNSAAEVSLRPVLPDTQVSPLLSDTDAIGIFHSDTSGIVRQANDAYLRMTGRTRTELERGLVRWTDTTAPELRERDLQAVAEAQAVGFCRAYENEYQRQDGSRLPVVVSFLLLGAEREQSVGFVLDLTGRRHTETELRGALQRLQFHVDNSPLAVVEWDAEFRVSHWSAEAERLFGWHSAETVGKPPDAWRFVYEEDVPAVQNVIGQLQKSARQAVSSNRNYTRSGDVRHCEWYNSALLDDAGHLVSVFSLVLDVTARKRAEEEREAHQREIETLNTRLRHAIRSSHDRIRNNLQEMCALIDLQMFDTEETIPTRELKRIGQHLSTLSVVHNLLAEEAEANPDAANFCAKTALETLLPTIQQMQRSENQLSYQLEAMRLPTRQATSLAILLNELLGNAFRHARTRIDLTLARTAPNHACLEVTDDGKGFPSGFDPKRDAKTGIALIERVSRWDMGGSTTYANTAAGGGRVVVAFPLEAAV